MRKTSSCRHRPFGSRCCYLALVVGSLLLSSWASAKTTSGDFRLSGLNTEYVLASFAVSAKANGYMKVVLTAKTPYIDDRSVRLRMYKDDQWPVYQKTPACVDKIKHAKSEERVVLSPKRGIFTTELLMTMENRDEDRAHYYYFVMDDCSLEMYMHDESVPELHYKLETWNDGNHFSADEKHLKKLHLVTLIVSGILGIIMALAIMKQLHTQNSVHAAMFLVMAAASCDAGSSFFEILHLSKYSKDGIGSYGLDALSAHLEAICDSLVALLLLTVGAGWTLPSDVIAVQQNASTLQKVLGGLQTPFTALQTFSPTAVLAIGILLAHIVLAQWGRIYNDDFDSYHDLEHLPGQCLMALRILLGLCMLICCIQTRLRCPASLQSFYSKLAFVGVLWFASLPVLTWVCGFAVPYHWRHWMVGTWGAALQSSSILLLTWLVTSHSTSYHKLSHLSSAKDTLTDSLSAVSSADSAMGKAKAIFVGNSKIRLD
jgi:hypothetical protein